MYTYHGCVPILSLLMSNYTRLSIHNTMLAPEMQKGLTVCTLVSAFHHVQQDPPFHILPYM